jgi:hypothetical protein
VTHPEPGPVHLDPQAVTGDPHHPREHGDEDDAEHRERDVRPEVVVPSPTSGVVDRDEDEDRGGSEEPPQVPDGEPPPLHLGR